MVAIHDFSRLADDLVEVLCGRLDSVMTGDGIPGRSASRHPSYVRD